MTQEEIRAKLEELNTRLEAAQFSYSVSPWSSGPAWREAIREIELEIYRLEKEMDNHDA